MFFPTFNEFLLEQQELIPLLDLENLKPATIKEVIKTIGQEIKIYKKIKTNIDLEDYQDILAGIRDNYPQVRDSLLSLQPLLSNLKNRTSWQNKNKARPT